MSKKMMKRSLALGALMAFMITGQVWADTPTKVDALASRDNRYTKFLVAISNADVVNSNASYSLVNDAAPNVKDNYQTGYTLDYSGTDGNLIYNGDVIVYQESNSRRNTTGTASIQGVSAYGGKYIEFNGANTTITVKSKGQDGSAINSYGVYAYRSKEENGIIFGGTNTSINVDGHNKEIKDAKNNTDIEYGAVTGIQPANGSIIKTLSGNSLDIKVNSYGKATTFGIASTAGIINAEGNVKVKAVSTEGAAQGLSVATYGANTTETINGDALITFNGGLDIESQGATEAYGINAKNFSNQASDGVLIDINSVAKILAVAGDTAYGICVKNGAGIDLADTTITATSTGGYARGMRFEGASTGVVNGDLTITATGVDLATGVDVRGTSE